MQADLILYALVAAGLVFWLRSVLGTRHGDERERPNPFTAPPPETKLREAVKDSGTNDDAITALPLQDAQPVLPRNVTLANESVNAGFADIARQEREFDLARFTQGAQDAFVMIVEAFAQGDRETLKTFLEPQVYAAFDGALTAREAARESMTTEIHAVRKVEILDAHVREKQAFVTIRFIADETCVIRSEGGAILSGDPDRITEMNDIWTFSKPLRSRDPVWFLHETRDGDVKEEHKTPVPDSA